MSINSERVLIYVREGNDHRLGGQYAFLYYLKFETNDGSFYVISKFINSDKETIKQEALSPTENKGIERRYTLKNFIEKDNPGWDIIKRNIKIIMSYLSDNWSDMIKWADEEGMLQEARVSAISQPSTSNQSDTSAKDYRSKEQRTAPTDDQLAQDWGYDDWEDFSNAQD